MDNRIENTSIILFTVNLGIILDQNFIKNKNKNIV